jgi:AcrR family transcriptional regulator
MSAQPSSLPARKQERGTAAQRKMVEAAEALIAEGGLGHATMARIGERAGYSRGLADYHFASKSEIVEKIIDHIAAGWLQTIQAPAPRRGMPALAHAVEVAMTGLEENPDVLRVLQVLAAEAPRRSLPKTTAPLDHRSARRWHSTRRYRPRRGICGHRGYAARRRLSMAAQSRSLPTQCDGAATTRRSARPNRPPSRPFRHNDRRRLVTVSAAATLGGCVGIGFFYLNPAIQFVVRNCSSRPLTTSGCSCWTQCPAPSTNRHIRMSVHPTPCIASTAPGD